MGTSEGFLLRGCYSNGISYHHLCWQSLKSRQRRGKVYIKWKKGMPEGRGLGLGNCRWANWKQNIVCDWVGCIFDFPSWVSVDPKGKWVKLSVINQVLGPCVDCHRHCLSSCTECCRMWIRIPFLCLVWPLSVYLNSWSCFDCSLMYWR